MKAKHWEKAKTLVPQAEKLSLEERPAFLDEECGDDKELRDLVESLLGATGPDLTDLLGEPPARLLVTAPAPTEIEAYKVIRELGRGGVGVVYLAEHTADQLEQQVAIKVLSNELDPGLSTLFRKERQILANLVHVGICRFFSAGSLKDGRPYFVMEYLEGISVTEYCASQNLSVSARLKLFLKICEAVHFAHKNLVVHRDLKPGNIWVTAEGEPKLLDFGVAKILNLENEQEPEQQLVAERYLTPSYASPEQIKGLTATTTAADIYSLGVVLYQLLTGRLPRQRAAEEHGDARSSQKIELTRPSAAVATKTGEDAKTTPTRLHKDLDAIVLKALQADPEKRYSSVDQLADDIDRHLKLLPVKARPDAWLSGAGKFIRRNKIRVASAIFVLVLTSAYLVERESQRREIRNERDKAQAASQFLQELFHQTNTEQTGTAGTDLTALDLLDQGAQRIQAGELSEEPIVEAAISGVIGASYQTLGNFERATELLERALALREEHLGDLHADTLDTQETLAQLYVSLGDYDGARGLFVRVLKARRQEYGEIHHLVGRTLNNVGLTFHEEGRFAEARDHYEESAEIFEQIFGRQHLEVAYNLNNLARTYLQLGEYDKAETTFLRVGAIFAELLPPKDARIAINSASLGTLYIRQGRFQEAQELTEKALAIREEVLVPGHPDIGKSHRTLGRIYLLQENHEAAETHARESVRIFRKAFPDGHKNTASALEILARTYASTGRDVEAEALYRETLQMFEETIPEHQVTRNLREEFAEFLSEQGREEEARVIGEGISSQRDR